MCCAKTYVSCTCVVHSSFVLNSSFLAPRGGSVCRKIQRLKNIFHMPGIGRELIEQLRSKKQPDMEQVFFIFFYLRGDIIKKSISHARSEKNTIIRYARFRNYTFWLKKRRSSSSESDKIVSPTEKRDGGAISHNE